MYFAKFPTITYPFEINGKLTTKTVTDITINVRIIKEILANLTLYDEYDIKEGDTPEIIAEKVYGSPLYHWVLMITNDRFDYTTDFPLTTYELEQYVLRKYGNTVTLKVTQPITNSTTVNVESTNGLIVGATFNYRPKPSANLITTYITEIINDTSFTVSDTIASLRIDNAIFTANGNIVTYISHGFQNGDSVIFSYILNTVGIVANRKYFIINKTDNTFQLSQKRGGTPLSFTTNGTGVFETGIVNAHPVYGVHHYEDDKGNIINKGNINVYGIASVERIVSNYDYETRLNESKRRIKLISPENLFRILAQFKSLV